MTFVKNLFAAIALGCCIILAITAVNVVYTTALAHRDYYRAAAEQARAATECMRRPPQLIAGPATYVPTSEPTPVDEEDWWPVDESRRPESRLIQPRQIFD